MKKPLISIIIPTKNSKLMIDACLESIKNQIYKDFEIIVVDNNSIDKTKEIARKYTKLVFNKGPERSVQRNFGALKSNGQYLMFIDSDMELGKSVVADCIKVFQGYKVSKINKGLGGIVIPEESFGKGFWAKCVTLERSFYVGVEWMEAARFFPKTVFNEFKGYDNKLISGEDWDLNQNIKTKYEIFRIKSFIRHNEGKLSLLDLLKKKMYYVSKINNYSSKLTNSSSFTKQSSIIGRYILFFSNPVKLFKDPIIGLGMLFMKMSEFAAGGAAYIIKK